MLKVMHFLKWRTVIWGSNWKKKILNAILFIYWLLSSDNQLHVRNCIYIFKKCLLSSLNKILSTSVSRGKLQLLDDLNNDNRTLLHWLHFSALVFVCAAHMMLFLSTHGFPGPAGASWSPTESSGAGWANKQFQRPGAPHSHSALAATVCVIFIWGFGVFSSCLWALKLQLFFEHAFVMYNNHLPTHQVRSLGWEAPVIQKQRVETGERRA